jgi:hypothetical protein
MRFDAAASSGAKLLRRNRRSVTCHVHPGRSDRCMKGIWKDTKMKTRSTLTALCAVALTIVTSAPVLAERHDTDSTRHEPRPMFDAEEFGRADTNADGQLSPDELVAFAEIRRAERAADRATGLIERLDGDADGSLSLTEATTPPRPVGMFDRIDADSNGQVSREEFDAAMTRMHEGPRGRMHDDGHGPDRGN